MGLLWCFHYLMQRGVFVSLFIKESEWKFETALFTSMEHGMYLRPLGTVAWHISYSLSLIVVVHNIFEAAELLSKIPIQLLKKRFCCF